MINFNFIEIKMLLHQNNYIEIKMLLHQIKSKKINDLK